MITKIRWVVEGANGRIKQWRFLDKGVPNKLVKYIGDFVKIVCEILNGFRPSTLSIDTASIGIANEILQKSKYGQWIENLFGTKQFDNKEKYKLQPNWKHRSDWFSRTKGNKNDVYQMKQPPCYTNDHLIEDGL